MVKKFKPHRVSLKTDKGLITIRLGRELEERLIEASINSGVTKSELARQMINFCVDNMDSTQVITGSETHL